MTLNEILTLGIALYGAIIATYTLYLQRKDNRPAVSVKLASGFLDYGGRLGNYQIHLEAMNQGARTVTLSSVGLLLPGGKSLALIDTEGTVSLPHDLLPGKNALIWLDAKELARQLRSEGFSGKVKLTAFYRDQTDRTYKSKPVPFNVAEWSKNG